MRVVFILVFAMLAACSSAAQEAEKKYEMAGRSGDVGMYRYRALCPQAKAVAAAYLSEGNEQKYRDWKSKSDSDCASVNDPFAH